MLCTYPGSACAGEKNVCSARYLISQTLFLTLLILQTLLNNKLLLEVNARISQRSKSIVIYSPQGYRNSGVLPSSEIQALLDKLQRENIFFLLAKYRLIIFDKSSLRMARKILKGVSFSEAMSYINACTPVTAGTLAAPPKDCWTESRNMYQNQSDSAKRETSTSVNIYHL